MQTNHMHISNSFYEAKITLHMPNREYRGEFLMDTSPVLLCYFCHMDTNLDIFQKMKSQLPSSDCPVGMAMGYFISD